jgi:hypothetical protein
MQLPSFISTLRRSFVYPLLVFCALLTAGVATAAWSGPCGSSPTACNAAGPVDLSSTGQTKVGGLTVNTGGATNGLIVYSGNVGIGTTNPLRKLEVNSVMKFTNSSANPDDGVIGTAPYAAGLNIVGINTDGGGRKVNEWGSIIQNENPVGNTFVGNSTFTGDVNGSDFRAVRASSPTTGVIYLGNSGGRYLYYDGSNYYMEGGNLRVNGQWVCLANGTNCPAAANLSSYIQYNAWAGDSGNTNYASNGDVHMAYSNAWLSSILGWTGSGYSLVYNNGATYNITAAGVPWSGVTGKPYAFNQSTDVGASPTFAQVCVGNCAWARMYESSGLHFAYPDSAHPTTADGDFTVNGTTRIPNGPLVVGENNLSASWAKLEVYGAIRGGDIVAENTSGGSGAVKGNSFQYLSDERLKKDIHPLADSLSKVLKLQGVSFEWKDGKGPAGTQIGFIAQQVEPVVPEVVTTGEDGYKGVDYAKMTALLVEAVKEQQKQIDDLKAQIEDLKAHK